MIDFIEELNTTIVITQKQILNYIKHISDNEIQELLNGDNIHTLIKIDRICIKFTEIINDRLFNNKTRTVSIYSNGEVDNGISASIVNFNNKKTIHSFNVALNTITFDFNNTKEFNSYKKELDNYVLYNKNIREVVKRQDGTNITLLMPIITNSFIEEYKNVFINRLLEYGYKNVFIYDDEHQTGYSECHFKCICKN